MKKILFCNYFILSALLFSFHTYGQQCNCDYTISLNASQWFFDGAAVLPGQRICFASGTRTGIEIRNVHGTPENPVIITNECNGKVTISSPPNYGNSFTVKNCSNIQVTGTGNPNEEYGIEITGAVMGINFLEFSTDMEVDHLYVHDVICVGIVAKTDPTCNSATWRGNFTLHNARFHHNKIMNTGCEGFYIGNSHYDAGVTKTCGGTPTLIYEHGLDGVQVYNNLLNNIGNDGIQVGGAINATIHHNTVTDFGTNGTNQHKNGIQCGNGTTQAKVYNNKVENGGYCFFDYGGGGVWYNNIGRNCSEGGFIVNDVLPNLAPTGFVLVNNTLIDCMKSGLMVFGQNTNSSLFANNIIAVPGHAGYAHVKYNNASLQSYWTDTNNLKTNDISTVLFANSSDNNYHLLSASPAVDGGLNVAANGVTHDLDENIRPSGNAFDIGAYEFINTPPIADAGSDVMVLLPETTATVNGAGNDADGTITSFSWTKLSGSTVTMSDTAAATLGLSGLSAEVYVFALTVTDNNGSAAQDNVTVIVNGPPVADAGADQLITLPVNFLSIMGAGTDADGTITSFAWTHLTGDTVTLSGASTPTLSVSGMTSGTYAFRLTVTDNYGASSFDDVVIVVNAPPQVNAGSDHLLMLPATSVVLPGTVSDPDGTINTITWSKLSGGPATLNNENTDTLFVNGLSVGTYVFRLTATDNQGGSGTDEVTVTVDYADEAMFNFSNTSQNIPGWNTLGGAPHSQFIEVTDVNSNIRVNSVSTGQWNPVYYGMWTTSYNGGVTNGTVQPAPVVQTNWFNYNSPYGSTVNGILQGDNVQILDLLPNHEYQLSIGASRITGGSTGIMEYRFNGVNPQHFDVTDNATNQIVVNAMSDANGRIGISARKISGGALNFGYIGWLVVTKAGSTNPAGRVHMAMSEPFQRPMKEIRNENWVTVFPNPAEDEINLEVNQPESDRLAISLKDVTGKTTLVREVPVKKGFNTIAVNGLREKGIHSGLYILDIISSSDKTSLMVIVK